MRHRVAGAAGNVGRPIEGNIVACASHRGDTRRYSGAEAARLLHCAKAGIEDKSKNSERRSFFITGVLPH